MSCDTWDKEYGFGEAWEDLGSKRVYAGSDDQFREAYARVLVRLPKRIRHFAQRRCLIFSVGRNESGTTWPTSMVDKRQRKWLIVMIDTGWRSQRRLESAIAHEIAHAWLKHNKLDPYISPNNEEEADEQAVAWGFSRSYPPPG